MPRRGENIYKRKDGRWEARVACGLKENGTKKYKSLYANSYSEVKEKQKQYMFGYSIESNKFNNLKFKNIVSDWLDFIYNRVKISTYRKYETLCINHINRDLGDMFISSISRNIIEQLIKKKKEHKKVNGEKLSIKTINDILVVLNLIFDYVSIEYDIVVPKITLLREEEKEARVLSLKEQKLLLNNLTNNINMYKFAAIFAISTGLRIGEMCALCWEDISNEKILVNKTLQRIKTETGKTEIIIHSPKTKSSKRTIPIPQFLYPFINKFKKECGYVISSKKGSFIEPRILQKHFSRIVKECNLEKVTFHTLRHTFATRCIEAGFDVKTLSEILGHSDVKTTLNLYVHSSYEQKRKCMDKLSFIL